MANDEWRSPPKLIKLIQVWKPIALDPCASGNRDTWFAGNNLIKFDDGLDSPWVSLTYCNPPYSAGNLLMWVMKAKNEYAINDAESLLLVPIDPSTGWWQANFTILPAASAWCSLNKRVRFVGATGSPRFSSALIYYGRDWISFARHFSAIGQCYGVING